MILETLVVRYSFVLLIMKLNLSSPKDSNSEVCFEGKGSRGRERGRVRDGKSTSGRGSPRGGSGGEMSPLRWGKVFVSPPHDRGGKGGGG